MRGVQAHRETCVPDEPSNSGEHRRATGDKTAALPDWRTLGCRVRRAARVATAVHLIQAAGADLDGGAVLEMPRVVSGG